MAYNRSKVKLPRLSAAHPFVASVEELGGIRPTARRLGLAMQTVRQWLLGCKDNRDYLLPAEQVPRISLATGRPPWLFRPDLWTRAMTFVERG